MYYGIIIIKNPHDESQNMFIQNWNFGNDLVLRCGRVDHMHNSGDHIHQFCEFIFVREGEIEITVDGKCYVAGPGDIAVILPFSVHSFHTPKHVVQLICVCSNAFFTDFIPFNILCKKRTISVFTASTPLWSYLMNSGFYDSVNTKLVFSPDTDYDYINKLKSTFYLILSEYFSKAPIVDKSGTDNTLSKILIYINHNYCSDLSLESVGAALGYSPKYISNCLHALDGLNFKTLVNALRVEKAKFLLISTKKTNAEISAECGFTSQASFQRVFHDIVGQSPKKYGSLHK